VLLARQSILLKVAKRVLPTRQARLISKSFDVIWDTAVLRVPDGLGDERFRLASKDSRMHTPTPSQVDEAEGWNRQALAYEPFHSINE